MIDAPVYIEYKNISSVSTQAEYQKDILSLVFQKLQGVGGIAAEISHDEKHNSTNKGLSNTSNKDLPYWELKCISCALLAQDEGVFLSSSLKKNTILDDKVQEASFETLSFSGKTFLWKVRLTYVKPFLVHAGDEVKMNITSFDGISMSSQGKSLKNGAVGDSVFVRVDNWFHKSNNTNSTKVIEATVTAANEVEYVNHR